MTDLQSQMPPHAPRRAFALLATVQTTLIAAITLISIALPQIQHDLGSSSSGLALVTAVYGVAFCGLLLPGARVGDRFGRRRVLLAGMVFFGVGSAGAALAPGLGLLVAARFLQGCGAALAAPAAMALVGAVFPDPVRHARALAAWGGMGVTGAVSGTLLSGLLVSFTSWRWAFAIPVAVAAAVLVSGPRLLPSGPAPGRIRLDVPGGLLATAGLTACCFGLVETGDHGWSAPVVLVLLAGGVAFLGAFVGVESGARSPLVPLRFLASRPRVAALVAALLAAAGTSTVQFFLSLYLQEVRGLSPLATSAAFLPFGVALVATGRVAARLIARVGAGAAVAIGLGVAAVGLGLLGQLGAHTPYAGPLLAGLLVFPAGAALAFAGATVAAVERATDDEAGLAAGLVNTAIEAGPTVGFAVLVSAAAAQAARLQAGGQGPLDAQAGGYGFALSAAAAAFAVAAGLAALALRRSPERVETQRRISMRRRFDNQVALVTGGGSGIGRATALAFAREGATVVVAGRRAGALAETVELIEAGDGRASAVPADVTRAEDVAGLVDEVTARYGHLDVAFNNAGTLGPGALADLDEGTWTTVLATNLTGVWLSMKYEIAAMRENGGGAIVNMGSNIGTHVRLPGLGAYGASKAGVSALTRTVAREVAGDGIRVNTISPGAVDAPMSRLPDETDAERDERFRPVIPAGRVASTEEVAAAVLWLASPEAGSTIGHDLVLDGGNSA
jgi:NAD(P)-dependent dehydrogenase (short-subunit alcohol dehydrogenase family)/predicted MFS family arabinose efflux permease